MPRKVVITGGYGFLGWHLRCRLRALTDDNIVILGRGDLADSALAATKLKSADVVFHLAGENRGADSVVLEGNVTAAQQLVAAMQAAGSTPHVVYAGSIHADRPTAYGRGKVRASHQLGEWAQAAGGAFVEVRLPHLFGEHGRPHYNSVVATFCHLLAQRGESVVERDAELSLLHAQEAAQWLMSAVGSTGIVAPDGSRRTVSWLHDRLTSFATIYRDGDIPDLTDRLDRDLFNSYRSYCFPAAYPMSRQVHADARGRLFECVRSHGGQGQTLVSSSHPGVTRGRHFHLYKIERFLVLAGEARIALRRMFDSSVINFDVRGDEPAFVDMPTMWAHSITNTGSEELQTMFWAGDLFDPAYPDTFAEDVEGAVGAP